MFQKWGQKPYSFIQENQTTCPLDKSNEYSVDLVGNGILGDQDGNNGSLTDHTLNIDGTMKVVGYTGLQIDESDMGTVGLDGSIHIESHTVIGNGDQDVGCCFLRMDRETSPFGTFGKSVLDRILSQDLQHKRRYLEIGVLEIVYNLELVLETELLQIQIGLQMLQFILHRDEGGESFMDCMLERRYSFIFSNASATLSLMKSCEIISSNILERSSGTSADTFCAYCFFSSSSLPMVRISPLT